MKPAPPSAAAPGAAVVSTSASRLLRVAASAVASALALALLLSVPASAEVIGHMTPAAPLSDDRIAAIADPGQRQAWQAYLAKSRAAMAADKDALSAERHPGTPPPPASATSSAHSLPLKAPPAWYAGEAARRIANNILSFQTPAGGWGKNADRNAPPRLRGQHYVATEGKESWSFVGTIDNGATTAELQFLARVQAALPGEEGAAYRAAAGKGVQYLLAAQYPNGGWPQIYPLQGGYHDAVTFNDDAMAQVIELLERVASRQGDFAFVPPAQADAARGAVERGINAILASQVTIGGRRTAWCQQHDAITLAPAGARNFEPAALSSGESARLLQLLKRRPDQTNEIRSATSAGIAWLRSTALPAPNGGKRWARLYDLTSQKPIFGDRDRTIHDTLEDLSLERRTGYAWYVTSPAKLLDEN